MSAKDFIVSFCLPRLCIYVLYTHPRSSSRCICNRCVHSKSRHLHSILILAWIWKENTFYTRPCLSFFKDNCMADLRYGQSFSIFPNKKSTACFLLCSLDKSPGSSKLLKLEYCPFHRKFSGSKSLKILYVNLVIPSEVAHNAPFRIHVNGLSDYMHEIRNPHRDGLFMVLYRTAYFQFWDFGIIWTECFKF